VVEGDVPEETVSPRRLRRTGKPAPAAPPAAEEDAPAKAAKAPAKAAAKPAPAKKAAPKAKAAKGETGKKSKEAR
jgi:RNA polymerase primary sigma factor